MFYPLAFLCVVSTALAHIPFMDNGHYTSFDTAFVFPDESVARLLNINFGCDSPASFSVVNVQNSTTFHVGIGLPDIPALYNVKPNYWIIGKNVVPSDEYTDSSSDSQVTIPEGYTGYKVHSADSGMFLHFGDGPIKGILLLGVSVNVTQPGPVYIVVENPGIISSRVWLAAGMKEVGEVQVPGEASNDQVQSSFAADTFTATTCGSNSDIVSPTSADSSATSSSAAGLSETVSSASLDISGGDGATVTVTNEQTTVITITSCSHEVCHETTVPATLGPVTTTIEGLETIYTTWCPVAGDTGVAESASKVTTLVPVTTSSSSNSFSTITSLEAGAAKIGARFVMMAVPIALLF